MKIVGTTISTSYQLLGSSKEIKSKKKRKIDEDV